MRDKWRKFSLGEVSTLITSGSRGWAEYYCDSGCAFIRMGNIRRNRIELDLSDLQFVDLPAGSSEGTRTKLQPKDLLISITAELGKIGYVRQLPTSQTYISQHVCLVRIDNQDIAPDFVAYLLSSAPERRRLNRLNDAGAKAGLNLQTISRFCVTLPPLNEQRRIAEILRTWDEAIETLVALKAAKEHRHQALTRALVFGSLRLNGFRKTDHVVPHRWFTLPADWTSRAIGKVAAEVSERHSDSDAAEVLSCSKHDGFVRSLEYFKKQVFSADLANYKRIWRHDFRFPSNHVEEGSIGLQNLVDVGVVSPIYTVFRFASDKVDPRYAYAVLKTGLYRHIFEVSTSASVDRRGSLRWSEFSKLPFPLPPLGEQHAIVDVLQTAGADIAGLVTEIETLTRQKRGLMEKLLTGEWRVTPAEDVR